MSFLHAESKEAMKSEMNIFDVPSTQICLERGDWIPYKPIAAISEYGSLEFVVPGIGEEYTDLSQTLLAIRAKVVNGDGSPLATSVSAAEGVVPTTEANVAPVNYFMHSLFAQFEMYLGGKQVSSSSYNYPYRAFIEGCLSFGPSAKMSHRTCALWYKDKAGAMEDFANNSGLQERKKYSKGSKIIDMIGNLHGDLFNQERLIPNGVEIRMKLVKSKDNFHLMAGSGASFKTIIVDATLFVRRIRVNRTVMIAQNEALDQANAIFPLTRVEVKLVTIPAGVQSKEIDNAFMKRQPKRVIVSLVSNSATSGNYLKNPFYMQHFGLNYFSMYLDGQQIPAKPLQPDFDSNQYVACYHTLFSGNGIHFQDRGIDISRDEYANGYTFLCFDLSPDLSSNDDHFCLQHNGSLRIDLRFKEALKEAVDVILYAEFENIIMINRDRDVIVDYNT